MNQILMRVCTLVALLVALTPASAVGQVPSEESPPADTSSMTTPRRLQLRAHAAFAFGGSVSEEDVGSATLSGGPAVGVQASYLVWSGGRVLLSYTQQANGVELRDDIAGTVEKNDMTVRMMQVGGSIDEYLRSSKGRLWPHFAFTIGATQFDPEPDAYGVGWAFSWLMEGGFTFWVIRYFGINALVRLNGHVMQADNAAFCIQGERCTYLRSTQVLFQGEIGGGATLAF